MKALAAEMTNYFSKRLQPLGIAVKELTGDMQLTKGEILRTQVTHTDTHTQTWYSHTYKQAVSSHTHTMLFFLFISLNRDYSD